MQEPKTNSGAPCSGHASAMLKFISKGSEAEMVEALAQERWSGTRSYFLRWS